VALDDTPDFRPDFSGWFANVLVERAWREGVFLTRLV
jgi:hypothetical protein